MTIWYVPIIIFAVFFVIIVIIWIFHLARYWSKQRAMRQARAVYNGQAVAVYNGQAAAPGCPLSQYPHTALPPGAYPVQPMAAASASPPLPPATNVVTVRDLPAITNVVTTPSAPPPSYSEVLVSNNPSATTSPGGLTAGGDKAPSNGPQITPPVTQSRLNTYV